MIKSSVTYERLAISDKGPSVTMHDKKQVKSFLTSNPKYENEKSTRLRSYTYLASLKRAQTRWVSFNYGVPMATFQLHHQTLITIEYQSTVKTNQTSPNSMGLRRLITEFLWPPSSSIIRR
ncbi:hypothetical protein EVAR_81280_1 [Eumeta japonica]|uniref:Uncharacterized protein n=1 Tax=Eumeta variegata TaxID=151549 RepID=A0A4C1WU16_EUMVA|nr:hypothetical protein EVAR_81280_1 [Eumeta japonica]